MVRAARAPQRHLRPHPRPRRRVPRGSPLIRRPGLAHRRRDAPRARRARHLRGRLRLQHERRDVVRAEQPVPSEPAGGLHQRGRRVDALGDVPWAGLVRRRAQRGARGQTVSFSCLRQLEWVFTTPILLLLVQNLHAYAVSSLPDQQLVEAGGFAAKNPKMTRDRKNTYVPANRLRLVLADEVMILAGLLMPIFPFGAARARCCSSRCRASRTSSTTASTR